MESINFKMKFIVTSILAMLPLTATTTAANKDTGSIQLEGTPNNVTLLARDRSQYQHCTIDGLFCLPANYSKYVPPLERPGRAPMNIAIGFDNFEILKIDDRDFTVEINAYLIVKWKDSRVVIDFTHRNLEELDPPNSETPNSSTSSLAIDWIPVELELVDKIWLPDTEILRLKGFHSLSVLGRLQGLWMSGGHEVLFVLATRIRFMCPMNFAKFPMDDQTCKFQVGSFNYDNTKMRYETYFLPKLPNTTDPILDYEVRVSELMWNERYYMPQETGNYSVAGFKLNMKRKMTHYVITYFLPSGLFVVVSWASFLIPSDDIQGRMALLVTLFLVLVNIFNAITTNSPKADGLNALQAWVLTCIFFVFGALLEYSLILLHLKIYSYQQDQKGGGLYQTALNQSAGTPTTGNPTNNVSTSCMITKMMRKNRMVSKFDIYCLVVFPLVFILFAFIYMLAVFV